MENGRKLDDYRKALKISKLVNKLRATEAAIEYLKKLRDEIKGKIHGIIGSDEKDPPTTKETPN